MNIIVCIKQVPGTNKVKMNKETNTIIREGIESIINPFDTFAIEEALKLKDRFGGKVSSLSMGIPKTAEILKETLALGVDNGFLLSDRAFAGADSLATAYTLSMGIKKIQDYDLIICGKQATDGDTAQVGPSLAEKLGIPHISYVTKIKKIEKDLIYCERLTSNGYETLESSLPALITVVEDINCPRLPSINNLKKSLESSVTIWSSDDINSDAKLTGLNGSPTQVVKTFVPEYNIENTMLTGTPEEQSESLVEHLISLGFSLDI